MLSAQLKLWSFCAIACSTLMGCGGSSRPRQTTVVIDDTNVQTLIPLGNETKIESIKVSVDSNNEIVTLHLIKAANEAEANDKLAFKNVKIKDGKPDFIAGTGAGINPTLLAVLEPGQTYFLALVRVVKQPKCKLEISVKSD